MHNNKSIVFVNKVSKPLSSGAVLVGALVVVFVLALVMSSISDYNSHPDEKVHFEAVKYYSQNWLPPAIGDPETLESYSEYGRSRLNELGFYYFLNGKFSAIIEPFTGNLLLSARLFNLFLLLILIVMCIKTSGSQRLLFGVLLLTPQLWYIFSYVNSDAYAFFLTIVITAQLVSDNSLLKRYLNSSGYLKGYYGSLPLIVLVFFLYFARDNYHLYFIFLLLWGAWFLYIRVDRKQLMIKFAIMVSCFIALVVARESLDRALYGPDKGKELRELREIMADYEYKPSARYIGEGHPNLNLVIQGVGYLDLFDEPYNWHRGTFYTLTSAYGHLEYFASGGYYRIMVLLYLAMASLISLIVWKRGWEGRFFLLATILLTLLILYLSSYHSWTADFQPQGRYLFPVLGTVAFLFGRYCNVFHKNILFNGLLLGIASLSAYSFIFYGLNLIPKM